jgi:hypothetical protein
MRRLTGLKLPFATGIVTQQKCWKILTPNVPLVFVDFYRDIAVANDVRPLLGHPHRLDFGLKQI